MTRGAHLVAVVVLLLVAAPACAGFGDLRADQLSITAPAELAVVQPGFTLEWSTHDLPSSATQFAVLVDRGPMSPGDDVRSLTDDECRRRRGCPDAAYLRAHDIYLTSDHHVAIPTLSISSGLTAQTPHPAHQLVVVALDDRGRRVGEFSASTQVRFDR